MVRRPHAQHTGASAPACSSGVQLRHINKAAYRNPSPPDSFQHFSHEVYMLIPSAGTLPAAIASGRVKIGRRGCTGQGISRGSRVAGYGQVFPCGLHRPPGLCRALFRRHVPSELLSELRRLASRRADAVCCGAVAEGEITCFHWCCVVHASCILDSQVLAWLTGQPIAAGRTRTCIPFVAVPVGTQFGLTDALTH